MALRLGSIVEALGGELWGDAALQITALAPLESATPADLSFLSNPRYQQQLAASQAACVIVGPAMRDVAVARGACIVTDQPYLYFARVTQLWKKSQGRGAPVGIHPSAVVDVDADAVLEAKYNELVPVLLHGDVEICHWHLDEAALQAFLAQHSIVSCGG